MCAVHVLKNVQNGKTIAMTDKTNTLNKPEKEDKAS